MPIEFETCKLSEIPARVQRGGAKDKKSKYDPALDAVLNGCEAVKIPAGKLKPGHLKVVVADRIRKRGLKLKTILRTDERCVFVVKGTAGPD